VIFYSTTVRIISLNSIKPSDLFNGELKCGLCGMLSMIIYYLDELHVFVAMPWFRRLIGGQLAVTHRGVPVSKPGQSTLNICWTTWNWYFLVYFNFPLSVSLYQSFIMNKSFTIILILILLLSEGQTGKPGETSNTTMFPKISGSILQKSTYRLFSFFTL